MPFLPTPDILLAFTAASVLLILTPGPDMTFFLGQTLTAGRRRGFAALFGAMTGLCVHSMLAAFGLSALLVASAEAFAILKIVGVAYLLLAGLGFVAPSTFGLIPIGGHDIWLHLVLGASLAFFGFTARSPVGAPAV